MKRTANYFFLILAFFYFIFFGWPFVGRALDPNKIITQYSVHIWNMEGGLPGNSVFAIQQTPDGYIWLGTQDGLVRFDGIHFELFNKENITQLKNNLIRALYVDRNGTLWIGTDSGGLTWYKEGQFGTYSITKYRALYGISAINEDRWGNLWIGSTVEGLTCLSNSQFTNYKTQQGLPHNQVRFIHKDGNGDLWVTTLAGIAKMFKPGSFHIYAPQDDLPHYKTACLYEGNLKSLWIGTGGKGLFRLRNGTYTAYGTGTGLPNPTINYIYEDRMKNIWIGTDGGGLTRMGDGVFSTLSRVDGLACGYIYSIYEDREGSLWVGTLEGGLHQLSDNKFTVYTTREGLAHDEINCIHQGRDNHLWIGTKGGLNRLNLNNGKLTTVSTIGEGLLDHSITCIYEDSTGNLWFGTWKGLQIFKNGTFTTLTKKHGLTDNRVRCIVEDKKGNTWIGSQNGLNRFNTRNFKFTGFTKKEGLSSNKIEVLYKDSSGNLWIGTAAGLNKFSEGIITTYNLGSKPEDNHIRCAYEDNDRVLWFGTDKGLIRLEAKKNTRCWYNVECGLIENHVYSILEDDNGYIWLGGRNGISRIRKKELEYFSTGKVNKIHPDWYNEKDGMKSRWCNRSGCETRDGRFWFPTGVGMAMIDPNNIEADSRPPSLIIEKLIVDGESINVYKKLKKPMALGPGKKRVEFYYTSVSFVNPQKIKFKLKLAGYDRDWIDMGTARSTTYTRLSPGPYTFEVTACNPDGIWNETGASFSFYVKPHFYQTAWFYLSVALFVLLGAFSLYRFRIRQLKTREKELSALVELRTRDLKERSIDLETAHHKLKQSKEIIETKNRHIMDSIRYAQKIQQAMLPTKEKMARELTDYFVVFKPKDIVSGDFYWFNVIENQYFIAVADCTGHGVPGALLSMIGYLMFNEAINEKRIFEPARALSHLHQGFRSVLKQELDLEENDAYDTYDGMDVGLCRIDLNAGQITFAGAGHSLFYIKDSELIEIKGNRKSIGGRQREEIRSFTNHKIDIPIKEQKEKEIMIYLTTDGFADQQNPGNQKFGTRRLKEFLRDNALLSTSQQKENLVKALETHQANEEQRDDITVIGIRLRIKS